MKFTKIFDVKTEADFLELMEEIDNELKEKELAIFQRPTHAWFNISIRFNLGLTEFPRKREIEEGCYTGDDLTLRIYRWYEQRYGSRLNIDFSWKIPILIRDDVFQVRLPQVFGTVKLNIFTLIEGITTEYANLLNEEEVKNIVEVVQFGFKAKHSIFGKDKIILINQAIGDLEASFSHLTAQSPQYGLAKWSSLQASEKTIKAFIQEKGANFPTIHNLTKLAELAESLGLKPIPRNSLDKIQCEAGVRYGNPNVSKIEAMLAHHNSLSVCSFVTQQF